MKDPPDDIGLSSCVGGRSAHRTSQRRLGLRVGLCPRVSLRPLANVIPQFLGSFSPQKALTPTAFPIFYFLANRWRAPCPKGDHEKGLATNGTSMKASDNMEYLGSHLAWAAGLLSFVVCVSEHVALCFWTDRIMFGSGFFVLSADFGSDEHVAQT